MNDANISPWQALELSRYEEAIQLFTQGYAQSQAISLLSGRSLTYLAANRPRQALADLEEVVARTEKRFASDSNFAFLGICHWYLARPDFAIAQWQAGLNAPYVDAAGGVLLPTILYYAGIRLGDGKLEKEAQRLLRAHWQKFVRRIKRRKDPTQRTSRNFADPDLSGWPGAVVPFLLGQGDSAWLLHQARNANSETLSLRHECQAQFAIAVDALRSGNHDLFAASMAACAHNPKGSLQAEQYIARWEVRKDAADSISSEV